MKLVKTEDAVGMVLGHDMTRIVPGEFKGAQFRMGHVVRPEDVPMLLSMGKEHIYVLEIAPGMLHENDAAIRCARAAGGGGLELSEPKEGKVDLIAVHDGLLRVDADKLYAYNAIGDLIMATLPDTYPVKRGKRVAGTRAVPLLVEERQVEEAEALGPFVTVKPYRPRPCGIVVTGSEVYKGLVQDRFGPVVRAKLEAFGCSVVYQDVSSDDKEMTRGKIMAALEAGAELVCVTGGMSVDPDDATPYVIRSTGAEVITHGTPVLPGSMLMLAYRGDAAIFGLPGAVMFERITVFDLVLPRVLADERLTRQDFIRLGLGGYIAQTPGFTWGQP